MDNRYLYNESYFIKSRKFKLNEERLKELEDIIVKYKPRTVLDVGCGFGALVRRLNKRGIRAIGTDFAPTLKKIFWVGWCFVEADAKNLPFSTNAFDLVFSSDFFEHIDEADIEKVRSEMFRVSTGLIIARVAYQDKLTKRQKLYHVTNKPKQWWEDKLRGITLV